MPKPNKETINYHQTFLLLRDLECLYLKEQIGCNIDRYVYLGRYIKRLETRKKVASKILNSHRLIHSKCEEAIRRLPRSIMCKGEVLFEKYATLKKKFLPKLPQRDTVLSSLEYHARLVKLRGRYKTSAAGECRMAASTYRVDLQIAWATREREEVKKEISRLRGLVDEVGSRKPKNLKRYVNERSGNIKEWKKYLFSTFRQTRQYPKI